MSFLSVYYGQRDLKRYPARGGENDGERKPYAWPSNIPAMVLSVHWNWRDSANLNKKKMKACRKLKAASRYTAKHVALTTCSRVIQREHLLQKTILQGLTPLASPWGTVLLSPWEIKCSVDVRVIRAGSSNKENILKKGWVIKAVLIRRRGSDNDRGRGMPNRKDQQYLVRLHNWFAQADKRGTYDTKRVVPEIFPAEKPFDSLDSSLCGQIEPLHTFQLIQEERLQMEW